MGPAGAQHALKEQHGFARQRVSGMKVGRNDPCPCGSGKKYKKCCLQPATGHADAAMLLGDQPLPGRYFDLKGKRAEAALHDLAEKTFIEDWCYPNPLLPNGRELCDLLIVFGDTAIIWQLKDTKLDESGLLRRSDVEKNVRQVLGARRQLFDLKTPVSLKNPRRGKEDFHPELISNAHLICSFFGPDPVAIDLLREESDFCIHLMTGGFTSIALNELDTISDFCAYLKAKEALLKGSDVGVLVEGDERELLALYLRSNRAFGVFGPADFILLQDGIWSDLQKHPQYVKRKAEDRISYLWDRMIATAHSAGRPDYELVARELARLNRFQRRCAAKAFVGAHRAALGRAEDTYFRRIVLFNDVGITFCLLFENGCDDAGVDRRDSRRAHLLCMCHVARGLHQHNRKVVGIATDKMPGDGMAFEFCFLDIPEWSSEDEKQKVRIQNETGMLLAPEVRQPTEYEYPPLDC